MNTEDKLHPHLYARTPIDENGEDSLVVPRRFEWVGGYNGAQLQALS